jgi:2-polyprenyl-3-methyl-5-hydroxy-6-metoxy-1,4-benzoquinol methylase
VPDTLLDIGSGLGVFPYAMRNKGTSVWCTEINYDSRKFINSLGIKCVKELPFYTKFGMVSLIHVLEHMKNPKEYLIDLKPLLQSRGNLFIEVPSASEFEILEKHHDVFNSCHTVFFNTAALEKMLKLCGYTVCDMDELYYPQRNLTSLVVLCEK